MTPSCAWNIPLQRTFTSFPSGSVGAALLFLRAFVGGAAIAQAALAVAADQSAPCLAMVAAAALAGLALLPGFMTPLAGAVLAAQGAAILLFMNPGMLELLDSRMAQFEFVVMAATLAVLGPGAASIDARLFGRREVSIA
jgi:uncharacterized membrane protein YphA (DoxX/SURF4 family)